MPMSQFSEIRLLIFDLDGTLIDSKLDLAHSVNATRAHLGLGPLPGDTIESYVGDGAQLLIRRALGASYSGEEIGRALEFFLLYYRQHKLDYTRLYPGVREALDAFGAVRPEAPVSGGDRTLAVLTNKPVRISREILEGLGVARYFRYVYGGNSFENKKPHPEGVLNILHDCRIQPSQAMMVGDSDVDVITGRNAGIWTCGVSWGFKPETFEAHPPDLIVHSLGELAARLDQDALATDRAHDAEPRVS
jgi:phosphoglycolate phosphatase